MTAGSTNINTSETASRLYYYGARYYDPRISVFLGVDPLADKNPTESPYLYCSDNPIKFVDPDGNQKIKPISKPSNPPSSIRKMGGNGYTFGKKGLYGGTGWGFEITPAYSKNNHPSKTRTDVEIPTGDKLNNTNDLSRDTRNGEDYILHGRHDIKPENREGNVRMDFAPTKDENGNYKEETFEIGIITQDGKEVPLTTQTSNKPGNISTKYKLKEGEKIYIKGEGSTTTTTKPLKTEINN